MTNKPFIAQFGLSSGNSYLRSTSGKASVNAETATFNLDVIGSDGILVPGGNTAQRPTGANGVFRYNTETGDFEGFKSGAWGAIGGVSSGGDVTNAYLQATFLKLTGGTLTGNIVPAANATNLGNTIARWVLVANSGNFSGAVTTSTGFYPTSNTVGAAVGATTQRVVVLANTVEVSTSVAPISNTVGATLGAAAKRFTLYANTVEVSTSLTPISNTIGASLGTTTQRFNVFANTLDITGSFNPASNTVGTSLGSATARWVLTANTGNFSGAVTATGAITTSGGVNPTSNSSGYIWGAAGARVYLNANAVITSDGVYPLSNSAGMTLGSTTARWNLSGNAITVSGSINPVSNSVGFTWGTPTQQIYLYANSVVTYSGVYPASNTVGNLLGWDGGRWALYAAGMDVSGACVFDGVSTFTAQPVFTDGQGSAILTATGALGGLQLYGTASDAYLSFLKPGVFGSYIGIGSDNQFTHGGWSAGAAMYYAKFGGLGLGTAAVSWGSLHATGDVVSAYSDKRLKKDIVQIEGALDAICKIRGVRYTPNELSEKLVRGKTNERHVGVIAQEVQAVAPEVVVTAPFDAEIGGGSKSGENYLTVKYERLVPLLIEAIKELRAEVEELKNGISNQRHDRH